MTPPRSASRRRIAAALTAGALAAGTLAATAPAASAASTVTFCFDFADGRAYTHKPVFLMRKLDGEATRVRRTLTDADGCGMFAGTRTDRTFWVKARYVKASPPGESPASVFWFAGRSPSVAGPGQGTVDLGTGTVKVVRAISAVTASR